MTARPAPDALTPQQLDEYTAALTAYERHAPTGFDCCTAHPAADAARALLAEVHRLHTELAAERDRYKAGLRHADEMNNALMEEVQRYADGTERPVLWSVYNRMHGRALKAEAKLKRLADGRAVVDRTVIEQVRVIVRRLAAHAVGFGDVLDESDRGPWGALVGADIAALQAAVNAVPPAVVVPVASTNNETETGR